MESWFEINARKCDEIAFAWLQAQGFDPTEFAREPSPPSFRIIHLPTQEYFASGGESGGSKCTRPGSNLRLSQTGIGQPESWDSKLQKFKRWTLDLKEYLAALDEHRSSLRVASPLRTEQTPPIPPVGADLRTVRQTTPPPIPPEGVDLRSEDQPLIPQLGPPPSRVKTPPPISVSVLLRKLHMTWIQDLRLHVDALQSAMESDKKFFAAIIPYVKELARVVRLPSTEVTKSMFVAPLKRLLDFYADYQAESGTLYFPPAQTSNTEDTVKEIADLITKLTTLSDDQFVACFQPASSLGRTTSQTPGGGKKPTAIFVGHGRSKEWLELEKFLKSDLHLHCEEFNTEPTAGYTTQQRLESMLDRATFAFLVMTAEEKYADGSSHARENVIHEAGLFQGKLGTPNAILLVESGCAVPSNVQGLTHIPFPSANIRAAFHDVRSLLEARKILAVA